MRAAVVDNFSNENRAVDKREYLMIIRAKFG